MDFLALAKTRCSVRSYLPRAVEPEKLHLILEAGRIAPTAANRQPQRIVVVTGEEGAKRLKGVATTFSAPLVFIVCADQEAVWVRQYDEKSAADIDASIVTTHMMLEAADLGLGSCWICHFDPVLLRRNFQLPDTVEPVNILAVGYPAGDIKSPERHDQDRIPLDEIVHIGWYGNRQET